MPNQRDPDKRCVATWVPHELVEKLKAAAAKEKLSLSAFLERLYREAVEKFEKREKR